MAVSSTKRRHRIFEIRERDNLFEVYASTQKVALALARFKQWARGPYHVGLRRVLRYVDGEQYPVEHEVAYYISASRERKRQSEHPGRKADSEVQKLVKRHHAARVAGDAEELESIRALLLVAARRMEHEDYLARIATT
jgi:hypothetical protein